MGSALTVEQAATYAAGRRAASDAVGDWQAARAALRAIAAAEHPDLVDRFGRVWVWLDGDTYTHDDTLALPLALITSPRLGLPRPGLADRNPNYSPLCATCRRTDTTGAAA